MKKFLFSLLLLFTPIIAFAASMEYEAVIDNKFYLTLEEAVNSSKNGDTIKVLKNVTLENTLLINKNITIDLNNNNIESKEKVMKVEKGNLILTGSGIVRETMPNNFTIMLKGSSNEDDLDYSTIYIGSNVTLEGWNPLFIDQLGEVEVGKTTQSYPTAYGVKADIYGTLISKKDKDNSHGYGIYVNEKIKHNTNYPEIHIYDDAKITSDGVGIYIAGYSKFTIDKAIISGVDSGIAMKSGILNTNYTTLNGTGEKVSPVGSNTGINPTGAALQIESNNNYAGNMIINISNGKFTSNNTSTILEYVGNNTTRDTSITEISINGDGTYISGGSDATLKFSQYFNGRFVTGGNFTTDPSSYIPYGYRTRLRDGLYQVYNLWPTMATVNGNGKKSFPIIIIISIIAIIGISAFIIFKKKMK